MDHTPLLFRKELMGLILTISALILTILAMIDYTHNPKLDPMAMATLIAPLGAGGLLFYGIRATEGYFNRNSIPQDSTQTIQTTQTTTNGQNNQPFK